MYFRTRGRVQASHWKRSRLVAEVSSGPLFRMVFQVGSRGTAWAARFRRGRCARCWRKRGGRQIGDQPEKHFPNFGVSRPLGGLRARLGTAQILGGFRTNGAVSVGVHNGTSHMGGHCLSLAQSKPWFGHTVQNRDITRSVWMTMLHISNGRCGEFV